MGVNKVILVGNLGKDPEVRYTNQQMAVCNFSLATGERRKDQSGNWGDHTEWHNIIAFGKTAENCAAYLKKGKQVYIEGKIQTRKWQDKEGRDRYTTEIIANVVQFLGSKGTKSDAPMGDITEEASSGVTAMAANSGVMGSLKSADSVAASTNDVSFDDDDIPF